MRFLLLTVSLAVAVASTRAEDATYLALVPKKIRPNIESHVNMAIFKSSGAVNVIAKLQEANSEDILSSGATSINSGESAIVKLQIPSNLQPNKAYEIHVEGTGGATFTNSTVVKFVPKSVSVMVQTDKAMYKPGQKVNFRVIAVYPSLKPFKGNLDIELYDANQNKIKQWLQRSNPLGVIQDEMPISDQPVLGDWTFKITTMGDVVKKNVTIAEYVLPKYEVTVTLGSYMLTNQDLHGSVSAKYTHGEPVKGAAKVSLQLEKAYDHDTISYPIETIQVELEKGSGDFTVNNNKLSPLLPSNAYPQTLAGRKLKVVAEVTETVTGNILKGDSKISLEQYDYKMEFLEGTPETFKPGLSYITFLKVTQPDGSPLTQAMIGSNLVTVKIRTTGGENCPKEKRPDFTLALPLTGILPIEVTDVDNCDSMDIEVKYRMLTKAKYRMKRFKSRDNKGIQVSLENEDSTVQAGTNVLFQLKATESISKYFYTIISKGQLVKQNAIQAASAFQHQLSMTVDEDLAHQMAPGARIIVYYVTATGEVINDALDFNVDGAFLNKVSLNFDKEQAKPADNVTLTVKAYPGSQVNLLAVDQSVLLLKGGNDISQEQVVEELHDYDSTDNDKEKSSGGGGGFIGRPVARRKRCLCGIYPSFSGGDDSAEIFENAGVAYLSDAMVYKEVSYDYPMWDRQPGRKEMGQIPPGAANGVQGPQGGSSPTNGNNGGSLKTPTRVRQVFPETWLWRDSILGSNGEVTFKTNAPDTITSWVASAFAVHSERGLGIAPIKSKIKVLKPFFVQLNLPYSLKRGELFELKAVVFNYMEQDQNALVTLAKSDKFKVKVLTTSNNLDDVEPEYREVKEEIYVASGDATAVSFWIQSEALGLIQLNVQAQTTMAADALMRTIIVEPEGVEQEYSQSAFIDLTTSPTSVTADIPVSFPEMNTKWTKEDIVANSTNVKVTVIGDIMGTSISGLDRLLRMPYGCGEQNMINFAPTVYAMQYLIASQQDDAESRKKAVKFMEIGYQRELTYQHKDGSFSAFGDRGGDSGSMWLTSFVVKVFSQANSLIFVDSNLVAKAYDWMVQKQNTDGSFPEPGRVIHTEMQGGSSSGVSLTAFTVISVYEGVKAQISLENSLKDRLNTALTKAVTRLESRLDEFKEKPYILALITYALTLAESPKASTGLEYLEALAKTSGVMKYWETTSDGAATTMNDVNPYHRRHAKASDIELNAYALLIYAEKKAVTRGQGVMKYLVSQRNSLGGYASTQDTVMALQALSSYAALMPTDNDVTVTMTAGSDSHVFDKLTKQNSLILQTRQIPRTALSNLDKVTLTANGKGFAVVQVSAKYNVDVDSGENTVKIYVKTKKISRKKITINACATYSGDGDSGMAIMQINHLTGFQAAHSQEELTEKFKKDGVKRVEHDQSSTIFYFDKFVAERTCIEFESERVNLVDNLQAAPARAYKYYDPANSAVLLYNADGITVEECDICPTCCPDGVYIVPSPKPTRKTTIVHTTKLPVTTVGNVTTTASLGMTTGPATTIPAPTNASGVYDYTAKVLEIGDGSGDVVIRCSLFVIFLVLLTIWI